MKLIPNWRHCWKMTSVQLAALLALIDGLYAAWPAFGAILDPTKFAILNFALAGLIPAARITLQESLRKTKDENVN